MALDNLGEERIARRITRRTALGYLYCDAILVYYLASIHYFELYVVALYTARYIFVISSADQFPY